MDMPISPSQTACNQVVGKEETVLPVLQFIDGIDMHEVSRHDSSFFFFFFDWNGNIKKKQLSLLILHISGLGIRRFCYIFSVWLGNFNSVSAPQL